MIAAPPHKEFPLAFAAFIISHADADPDRRAARFAVHNEQIDEWLAHTNIPIHIVSMNYQKGDYRTDPRITYHDISARKTSAARHEAFKLFYGSEAEWGVIMDNDAMLYHAPQHNSAYGLIREMEQQLASYSGLGMFVPIDPRKMPFTQKLASDAFQSNHIFVRHMDVKGSMIFVRNFRRAGQTEIYPDTTYDWCEDGKLAMDAVAVGHSVMRCENIVLKEKGLASSAFGAADVDRKPFMQAANERMVQEFGPPLEMKASKPHLLERRYWLTQVWKGPTQLIVPKP
ncbi:hypothetical protein [Sphingobium lactosutens]|uniref:hypothetical protein n=1 Tax=Sphingobium lactosutens TaxID=522773 RepID=UPI0015BEC7CA|nr:hypothetical protein [Sphingobium lactosutens]